MSAILAAHWLCRIPTPIHVFIWSGNPAEPLALQDSHSKSSVHLEWESCSELAPNKRNLGFGSANFSKCMWISLCGITNLVLWRKRARVGWAGQGRAGLGRAEIGRAGEGAI